MQRIFSALKQAFRQSILILGLVSLISLSSLYLVPTQPSYAASPNQKLIQQENMDKESQTADQRERAYEEQVKASEDPDKVYEQNLKEYKKANPDQNLVEKTVEGTKDVVDKVTGKE
jgi:hypothetical protein